MSRLRWLVRRAPGLALLLAVCALFFGACHGGHDFVPHGGTVVAPAGYHHGERDRPESEAQEAHGRTPLIAIGVPHAWPDGFPDRCHEG